MSNSAIKVSFEAYNAAVRIGVNGGALTEEQASVITTFGELVNAVVSQAEGITDGEVMALLSLTLDYAKLLLGALDSACNKKTDMGVYYRQQVVPIMFAMLKAGVITEDSLPTSDPAKRKKAGDSFTCSNPANGEPA